MAKYVPLGRYEDVAKAVEMNPDEFARHGTWESFAAEIGYGERWQKSPWCAASYRTLKLNPAIKSGHPLIMPEARTFRDLFEVAIYVPAYAGPGNTRTGTPLNNVPGFYSIGGLSAKDLVPMGDAGGKRYVRIFPDGTCVRGRSGSDFHVTKVKPVPALLSEIGERNKVYFEAIRWQSGHVLITARINDYTGTDWVALLNPESNIRDIMSAETLAFIEAEKRADADAWGCIYKGEDGREYLNRDKCTVEIRTR